MIEHVLQLAKWQGTQFGSVQASQADGEVFRAQTQPMALRAGGGIRISAADVPIADEAVKAGVASAE